jgi:hypothetical protein
MCGNFAECIIFRVGERVRQTEVANGRGHVEAQHLLGVFSKTLASWKIQQLPHSGSKVAEVGNLLLLSSQTQGWLALEKEPPK